MTTPLPSSYPFDANMTESRYILPVTTSTTSTTSTVKRRNKYLHLGRHLAALSPIQRRHPSDTHHHRHGHPHSNERTMARGKDSVGANYIHHAPRISQQAYHVVCLRVSPLAPVPCPRLGSKRRMHDTQPRALVILCTRAAYAGCGLWWWWLGRWVMGDGRWAMTNAVSSHPHDLACVPLIPHHCAEP